MLLRSALRGALCIMSKIKSPREKKRISLARDRRNVFGESPHAARKSIPKRKAMAHQQERQAASQALGKVFGNLGVDALEAVENEATTRAKLKRVTGFKKIPDQPLSQVIKRKQAKRVARHGRRKSNHVA
jgi:hypothetical protein